MLLLSSADFFKINFFKKLFQKNYQNVGPDLGPNCLQMLSADDRTPASKKELINSYFWEKVLSVTVKIRPDIRNGPETS